MAAFVRLMRLAVVRVVFAAVLAAVGVVAWASGSVGPPQSVPQFGRNGHTGTAAEVCNALAADDQALTSPGHTVTAQIEGAEPTAGTTPFCRKYVDGGATGFGWYEFPADSIFQCPSNSAADSQGNCQCASGYRPSGGACVALEPAKTDAQCAGEYGSESGDSTTKYDWPGGTTTCHGGCVSTPQNIYGSGANQWATGPFTTVGGSCNGEGKGGGGASTPTGKPTPTAGDEDPAATACVAPNSCPGQVNGTTVCVPCGTTTSQSTTTKTTTTPDGATTTPGDTTTRGTTDNGNGTVTTTTTTTHADGSVDTKVTTGPKSGTSPSAAASAAPGFCDTNPNSVICKESHFGGACGASFTCDGDAIQCAIAKEQHVRACQEFEPATQGGDWAHGAQTLATAKADGDIPSWSPSHPGNAVETGFNWSTTIDHSTSFAASCPADVPIGSSGRVLPLAWLCPYFGVIGVLIESVTAVFCLVILFKGK